jgi:hypothetical protein
LSSLFKFVEIVFVAKGTKEGFNFNIYKLRTLKKKSTFNVLRTMALIVLLAGAAGSLGFMFNAGRNQKSILLIALFTIWVLSPFIALQVANVISKRWSILTRRTLYFLISFITLGSLVSYSGALSPPGAKPAF